VRYITRPDPTHGSDRRASFVYDADANLVSTQYPNQVAARRRDGAYVPLREGFSDFNFKNQTSLGWDWSKSWAKHVSIFDVTGNQAKADVGQTLTNPTRVEEAGTSQTYYRQTCVVYVLGWSMYREHKVVVEFEMDRGIITAYWRDVAEDQWIWNGYEDQMW